GEGRRRSYLRTLQMHGQHLAGRPMSSITVGDAQRFVDNLYICKRCRSRAEQAGRDDLLDRPDLHFHAATSPWDGGCVDENGESTHMATYAKSTISDMTGQFKHIWNVAKWAGAGDPPRDSRCGAITGDNPFQYIA